MASVIMTDHMSHSQPMFVARPSGTLGRTGRTMVASKVLGVSWATSAEVCEEVASSLGAYSETEEVGLLADILMPHRWPKGHDELKAEFDKDVTHLRRLLNQSVQPVTSGRTMMGWLRLWQAVYAAWAKRRALGAGRACDPDDPGGLPPSLTVSDTNLSAAINATLPSMLPTRPTPEGRAGSPPARTPEPARSAKPPPNDHPGQGSAAAKSDSDASRLATE